METWRAVVGFEGRYEVSDFGRVRRCARTSLQRNGVMYPVRQKLLKLFEHTGGYRQVCLRSTLGENGRMHYVHRLVAQAFLPNPTQLPEINHKDLDKTANAAANLEWCTSSENSQHAAHNGRFHGRTNPRFRYKLTPCSADAIRAATGAASDIALQYGVSATMVRHIKKGRRWAQPTGVPYGV